VEWLVTEGKAALSTLTNAGNTAVSAALGNAHLEVATLLVAHGAEATATDHAASSPERAAVERGLLLRAQVPLWIAQRMGRLGEGLPGGMPDCVREVVGQYFQPGAREAVAGLGGLGA
jgi:hypothetical protein